MLESQKRANYNYRQGEKYKKYLDSEKFKERNRLNALNYYYIKKEEKALMNIGIADEYVERRGRKRIIKTKCDKCNCIINSSESSGCESSGMP